MADVIEITAEVRERELRLTSIPMMPSGSRNHLRIRITFDSEWDGATKTLVAYRDLARPYHAPLGLDGTALIPHEVLAEQGVVYLGVFGVAGDQRVTSTIVRYGVNEGAITEGLQPSDPTPEMWDQLISAVNEVRQAAESAMRDAQTAAQSAQQSEQAAAGSATQADGAATRAETAADTAATSAQAAETAKTDAQTAQRTAAQSAADAKTAATRAEQAAGSLSTAVTQAQDAAQAAQQSATQAQEYAKSAGDSAASAAQAQQGATDAETAARQSAVQAQKSQETATQAAAEAGESARQAAGAQTAAQNSAQSAGQQANAAATSAQQAQQSQTAAAESATSAQESAAEATKQASASEASAVRAEKAANEVEQSAQQIAGAIDRLVIHETAAGNPSVIRDGADWQMEGLRVYGQSEQVTTTGANLLDCSNTMSNVGNTEVTLSGNLLTIINQNAYPAVVDIPITLDAGTYYMSVLSASVPVPIYRDGAWFSNGVSDNSKKSTIKIMDGGLYVCRITAEAQSTATVNELMISAKDVPYEPYTGGKPAPSPEYPQEIVSKTVDQIVVTGSNLLSPDDREDTPYNIFFGRLNGIYLFAGVKYVFSCDGDPTNLYFDKWEPRENVTKRYEVTEVEYTPSESGLYYVKTFDSNGESARNTNFRLNVGTAVPYEPYHAQTVKLSTPVTLRGVPVPSGGNVTISGQRYMADLITEREGVVGVERRIADADLKRLAYFRSNRLASVGGHYFISRIATPIAFGGLSVGTMCNILPCKNPYDNAGDNIWAYTAGASNEVRLGLADQSIDTKEKLLELLNGLPEAHAIFAVENTEFEPLPEADQQAIRELRTYHGNTVVTTGAHTEVDYISDPKLYIDGKVNALVTAYMQSIPVTIPLLDEEVVGNDR